MLHTSGKQIKISAEIMESVQVGAYLLDHEEPDWYNRIDEEILDTSNPTRCMLGQLFGDFCQAPVHYQSEGAKFGFTTLRPYRGGRHLSPHGRAEYEQMNAAWQVEIRERRAAPTAG